MEKALDKKEKAKEIISLKKQFLSEETDYEKKILFGIMGIGLALTAYFYKNPLINWLLVFLFSLFFSAIYELFLFLKIQERFNKLKREIEKGEFSDINSVNEDINESLIKFIWERSSKKIQIGLIMNLIILILLLALIILSLFS